MGVFANITFKEIDVRVSCAFNLIYKNRDKNQVKRQGHPFNVQR